VSTTLEDPRLQPQPHQTPEEVPATQAEPTPGPQQATPPPTQITQLDEEPPLTRSEVFRAAAGALSTTLGCAFLVGGMFIGVMPKIYAAVGGIVGVAMAVWAARAQKRATLVQSLSILGVIFAGIVLLAIGDFGAVSKLGKVISEAAHNARLHRPPTPFDTGWAALVPWTVGLVGYAAAWIGTIGRKPAVGILVPIPVIAFAAIAQPAELQVPAGIVAFVTFIVGLAVIYRADRGEGDGVSRSYELKRAMKTAPLILILSAGLIALAQTNLLFPSTLYDPTQRAQLPHSVPLKGVPDRVLFSTVSKSKFTGPWRIGVLDVYDGANWRLPPFAQSSLTPAPISGSLSDAFEAPYTSDLEAVVTVAGLDGTVLPLPARAAGITVDNAPKLDIDKRGETVRVHEGQVRTGLKYSIFFSNLPKKGQLEAAGTPSQEFLTEYTDVANRQPGTATKALIDLSFSRTKNAWDRLDFLRKQLLDNVTASGAGLPVEVPPAKLEDMIGGSKQATPYEIVAGQVLLMRFSGIPARIGYGFDHGEEKDGKLEFRPKYGASWMEVYFQGFGWFPVTGFPKHAKQRLGNADTVINAPILPSDQIAVELIVPLRQIPGNLLFLQIRNIVLALLPFAVLFGLVWLLWPIVFKARRRSKRRQWALDEGRTARIAVAYAELRDMATDLGVGDPYLTPLAYVHKVVPDDEHAELAWLVTRTLWGDLREHVTDDEVFAAEELSRSLRRRLSEAQPFTIRGIALVSRLSLRNPYAPELLSPPLQKLSLRKLVRVPKPLRLRLPVRRRKEEAVDEALEAAQG
jgi:hypothetical protein